MRQSARTVLAILAFLFFTFTALCQQNEPPKQSQPPTPVTKEDWKEHWRDATIAFGEILHDQTLNEDFFHAIGTGVIVSVDARTAYLVTARHMFCDPEKNFHPTQLRIRYAWQDRKSIYSYLGAPFNLRDSSGANLWRSSENGDVAAIPMPRTDADLPVEDRRKIYDSIAIDDVTSDVYEGESIFVFGYPGIVGNDRLVRAIVRQGIVAWTDPNQPDEKVFLVDANLYPGNSGGPVIRFPVGLKKDGSVDFLAGGKLNLLGIVSQAPLEEIKTTTVNPRFGKIETSTQITGIGAIGIIEPGNKIRKLLELIQQGKAQPPVCDVPDPVQEKSPSPKPK